MKQHNMPTSRDWFSDMAIGGLYLALVTACIAGGSFFFYVLMRWMA